MSDCVLFLGHIGKNGYGLTRDPVAKKTISAHRLVFKQVHGFLPEIVMHICDNPRCINPEHLKAGTQSDNILDSYNKGRSIGPVKLTKKQRELIKSDKRSSRVIAKDYNVNQKTICNIKNKISKYDKCTLTGHGGVCGA